MKVGPQTIALPKRRLVPTLVMGSEARRLIREMYDAVGPSGRVVLDGLRAGKLDRLDRERTWRIAHARRRLDACHWAGWSQLTRDFGRRWRRGPGERSPQGPKWLGRTRPEYYTKKP